MKIKLIFTVIIALISLNLNAQTIFQKTLGGPDYEGCGIIKQTTDSGFIMLGSTNNYVAGEPDIYLIKTDANGDTIWTKTYGGSNYESSNGIIQTTDQGYIIVGSTRSFGAGYYDVYVIKTDAVGDTMWTNAYGGVMLDMGNSILQTSDGGYVIIGETQTFGAGGSDIYLIKLSNTGAILWKKTYGGHESEFGSSIHPTSDNGFIITGPLSTTTTTTDTDIFLMKLNSDCDLLWFKTYGGTEHEWGRKVKQTADNGFIIVGNTRSFGAGNEDAFLLKTDSTGDIRWAKTYGGSDSDYGFSVQETSDTGYIITGATRSFGAGSSDMYLIKTDSHGDTLWTKTYGGSDDDSGGATLQISDTSYLIVGSTFGFGVVNSDIYLIKTDAVGYSGCNENYTNTIISSPEFITNTQTPLTGEAFWTTMLSPPTIISNTPATANILCPIINIQEPNNKLNKVTAYPNPFCNYATIEFDNFKEENYVLIIFNSSGQMVRKINTITNGRILVKKNNLVSGLYYLQLNSNKEIIGTVKLVIE